MSPIQEQQLVRLRFPGILAMDVSGTSITTAVCGFDEEGCIRVSDEDLMLQKTPIYNDAARRQHPDLRAYFAEVLVAEMARQLRTVSKASPAYAHLPVGVSFSGQVSPAGEIYSASSIFRGARPAMGHPLRLLEKLQAYPGLEKREFLVLNNISAAAWRLSLYEEVKSHGQTNHFLVVHVGSGFGSKVFDVPRQQVLLDEQGLAGELGHVRIDRVAGLERPLPCDCRQEDHLASYFLPEGLSLLCQHYARAYVLSHPDDSQFLQSLKTELATDFLKRWFRNGKYQCVAMQIIDTLVYVLAAALAQVVASVGIQKIVLKGGLFHRLGPAASSYFAQKLATEVQARLAGWFSVPRDFVILRAFPNGEAQTDNLELRDRRLSLEGLLVYAAELYRSTHRVTSGYFEGNPCFTLSCANDIRYPVIRSAGVFEPANSLLRDLTQQPGQPRKLLIILDRHYDKLKGHELTRRVHHYFQCQGRKTDTEAGRQRLSFEAVDVIVHRLSSSQECERGVFRENKTVEQVNHVVSWCQEHKLPRDGMLIALGGGVTLDIVGFAAQQYRRMVSYIRIPTTLIGQVDAGVGVKVGVNYGDSKNLIGAFYPPYATVNDPEFLYDLEPSQVECGLAEIIKMGIIVDGEIVTKLEELYQQELSPRSQPLTGKLLQSEPKIEERFVAIADDAIESMMVQLQKNITERELKRLVDFGHTFSPRIESLSGYRIAHGYAVAMDMYLSCYLARHLPDSSGQPGLIGSDLFHRYRDLLGSFHLLIAPYFRGVPVLRSKNRDFVENALDECLRHRGGNLNLVVPATTVGQGGFVNLASCGAERSGYAAVVTRKEFYRLFAQAVDSLYRIGSRKDFQDVSHMCH